MPTYEYSCKTCGEHVEVVQSFKDDALTVCPACGGDLRKVFGNIGIAFKGSGFYKNDSRDAAKKGAKKTGEGASEAASATSSGEKSADKAEKSADKGSDKSVDKPAAKAPDKGSSTPTPSSAAAS